ncbi:MAG: HEPN domain-containing protein [Nanoarchaeota archaeon]|nr:HEPN domain-containing protein [Nanoarchaeota archaeon]MBU1945851.1 HEPN domain-containing protein [Nanoarchaeota archaeon]
MKKISFLIKLNKEGKLQEVEPSDKIKDAYIQRSNESLSSAKTLLKVGNLKDAVALSYYSMYHCILAALFRIGIKCENHTASIILLKEVFGIDNSKIAKAKSERIDKQYYVDFTVNQEEVSNSIIIAEGFIAEVNDLIATLNEAKIKIYRERAVRML